MALGMQHLASYMVDGDSKRVSFCLDQEGFAETAERLATLLRSNGYRDVQVSMGSTSEPTILF